MSHFGTRRYQPLFTLIALIEQDAMNIESLDYAQLSENEMAAADRAATLAECQAHLDRAVRYAQLACLENQRSRHSNVVAIGSALRREA